MGAADNLSPDQFASPVRPRLQEYMSHPYAHPEVVDRMQAPAARDDWGSLRAAGERHFKMGFLAFNSGNNEKSNYHHEAEKLAKGASNEARLAVEYPKDEHPLFGRGGAFEGMTHEEADRHLRGDH